MKPTPNNTANPATHITMTFAEKLQSERHRLNLTQAKAAALLGISKSALEKWEAGVKTPKLLMQEGAMARFAKIRSPS